MIRFIDITEAYWTDGGEPICSFLSTVTNKYYHDDCGDMTFSSMEEIDWMVASKETRERCKGLVPDGFFDQPNRDPVSEGKIQ